MHIHRIRSGSRNQYTKVLLRESYRDGNTVKKRTIANLSDWDEQRIAMLEAALRGGITADTFRISDISLGSGKCYGALYAFASLAKRLGITKALGSERRAKLALLMIVLRPIRAQSKLAIVSSAANQAIREILGIEKFDEDDLYAALDFLEENQAAIEEQLFKQRAESSVKALFLYDVTSSYLEGEQNELAAYGYNRDKKKGKKQIVIGLLMDQDGVPVSVEVFRGNTADQTTVASQLKKLKERFGVERVVFVGDRGMIKSAQIKDLKAAGWNYIRALTKPQVEKLLSENVIQLGLFQEEICEIEFEGKRLVLRRNPVRQEKVRQSRNERINKIIAEGERYANSLKSNERAIPQKAYDRLIVMAHKLEVAQFVCVAVEGRNLSVSINREAVEQAQQLDGCYVIESDVPKEAAAAETIHSRYKDLKLVEDAFRTLKTELLEIRPLWHRLAKRTRGHVFLCMLSLMLTLNFRRAIEHMDLTLDAAVESLNSIQISDVLVGKESVAMLPRKLRDDQSAILEALKLPWGQTPRTLA